MAGKEMMHASISTAGTKIAKEPPFKKDLRFLITYSSQEIRVEGVSLGPRAPRYYLVTTITGQSWIYENLDRDTYKIVASEAGTCLCHTTAKDGKT